ncbi:replication protein [Fluoribacter gormanii]|uniref:replication protein n=1 Tax=Fluoribacter gormanii TaxID=464 RepID=UPI002243EE44|nr:replication protein [Fluoribacter gormanii]MCW8445711.1 replication protein [Fluoribacter gormanii]
MAVLRIHKKQQNFVILDKTCLNDDSLSWGAKGLHAYLMSLPDDWRVRVSDLRVRATNGRDAVRGLLCELELAGYIQKSICREDASGRFGGIEYLVLEIPERQDLDRMPEPEKPSSVKNEQTIPSPDSPETGNPTPVNTTLININRLSNKKLNNKTAAASTSTADKATNIHTQSQAAAVAFSQTIEEVKQIAKANHPVERLSQEDALIGSKLTHAQKHRVRILVKSLNISQKEELNAEIEFCLLNTKHFTACGNDFSRKLNAIRGVILRGDWQTPAGMVLDVSTTQKSNNLIMKQLEHELREAHAEVSHFEKLLITAKEHTRAHFETIISQAKNKIHDIEAQLRQTLSSQQEAYC